jgi:protein SCO1/2
VRLAAICVALLATPAFAQGPPNLPSPQKEYSYEQRLGVSLPLDAPFLDEQGRTVRLGDYFGRRPVVIVLVQYLCPQLCGEVLNGLVDCLSRMEANAGEQFDVVVVSFDPRERPHLKPELALDKKDSYVRQYRMLSAKPERVGEASYLRPSPERGWHFLSGEQESIDRLTISVGFRYFYVASKDRYAHPSGGVIVTPEGKVSKYFFGIAFTPSEMEAALRTASTGNVGRGTPPFPLLLCYDLDMATGDYRFTIMSAVRLAGALTVFVLAVGLGTAWIRDRFAARRSARSQPAEEAKHAD